jgi:hypothetical protein
MKEEIWEPVLGYVGIYEVSSHGRVRSLEREVPRGDSYLPLKSRILKSGLDATTLP